MRYNQKVADELWTQYSQHVRVSMLLCGILVLACLLNSVAGYMGYSNTSMSLWAISAVLFVVLLVYDQRRRTSRDKWRSYTFSLETNETDSL